ncbi:MAG TPA: hypothetical protein VLJ37_08350 [bacterium]|nr:hypothetical protein [bacterium]
MKKTIALTFLLLLPFALGQTRALACGGPAMDEIDIPLQSPDTIMQWLTVVPCEGDSACGFIEDLPTVPELLFLQPFRLNRPREFDVLWKLSYEFNGTTDAKGVYVEYQPPEPLSAEGLNAALRGGEYDKATAEAQGLFDRVMNLPVALAENNQGVFAQALAVVEMKTIFGRSSLEDMNRYFRARLGTLRFIALKQAMRTQIPDGWKEEIQKKTAPESWKALEALHDEWIKDFPDHPLADLVRLSKLRLYYLQDEGRKAWNIVFDVYRRRPIRALAEMRFLLKQSLIPEFQDVPQDPVLLAALAPWFDDKDSKTWTTLWRLSESNAGAPWSVNLQERLLKQAGQFARKDRPLPEGFPDAPGNPTQLWGQFRLLALYKTGNYDQALAEAESLKPNAFSQAVQAKLYLMRREWAKIMALEKLPMDSKKYLIRVLLDDASLKSLADNPQEAVRSEARLALAIRLASRGDWNGGAKLVGAVNPDQAALWRGAAKLASDQSPAGRLAWARFLGKNDGRLFYKPDTVWYRSLFGRFGSLEYAQGHPDLAQGGASSVTDTSLPWTGDQEAQLLLAHFTSLEPYLALKAYAAWLEKAGGKAPQAKAVLKEADKTYNALVNWANNYSEGWKAFLDKSPEAQTIRTVGLEIGRKGN